MATRLTYAQLAKLDPCDLDSRKTLFAQRKSLTVLQALEAGVNIEDLLWVAGKLGRKDLCVQFALLCAQRVAHLNTDPRVQAALDATQAWLDNPTDESARAAYTAANATAYAANAANAANAAVCAACAAYAAACAANAANAAYAAYAAAYAAYAADAEEETAQREIFRDVFKDA